MNCLNCLQAFISKIYTYYFLFEILTSNFNISIYNGGGGSEFRVYDCFHL